MKKSLIIHSVFNIPILMIFCILSSYEDSGSFFMFFVSIVQLVGNLYILFRMKLKLISLPIIFIILSYVFHFGHLPLTALEIPFGKSVLYPLWYVSPDIYYTSFIFSYLVQYMVIVGIVIVFHKFNSKKQDKTLTMEKQIKINDKLKIIGLIFVMIGLFPTLYIEITKVLTFMSGGYSALFEIQIRDFIQVIANCINFGLLALMIGFSNEKKNANIIFSIAIVFKVLQMISGGRGESIAFLIALVLIWSMYIHEIKIKEIISLGVIGYVFLVLLNFIAKFRVMEISFDNFLIAAGSSLQGNQIADVLSEFGSTFATVCFSMESLPAMANPTFGLNYILPIVYILPNLGGFNQRVVDLSIYTNHVYAYDQPIGGSYIGELYYSFNWSGVIFAVLIGVFIAIIACKLIKYNKTRNNFKFLLYAQTISYLIFWIRGYFGALYRGILWHSILAILLWIFLDSKYSNIMLMKLKKLFWKGKSYEKNKCNSSHI